MMKNQKGFSLLEIMVAVTILSTSFVILIGSQSSSLRASQRAERITVATLLAQQKMSEYEITLEQDISRNKFPRDEKEESGKFDEPYEDYRWLWKIKKVEIPVLNAGGEEGQNPYVATYLKNVSDQISKSVRELELTIFWGDEDIPIEEQPNLVITSHIVDLR